MKKIEYLFAVLSAIFLMACAEKELLPISQSEGEPKAVVIDKIENVAGGANITFVIPDSKDLLMVKGVYTRTNGLQQTAVASKYENKLKLTGYNDTNEHEVILYAVNGAMEESEPLKITIKPEKSPLKQIEESMQILPDFGGARFVWENVEKAPVTIDLLVENDKKKLILSKIFYSSSSSAYQALRGYEPEARMFAAVIRDVYGNTSDTIFPTNKVITPILELQVDKKGMQMFTVKGDGDFNIYGTRDFWMFDGDVATFAHSSAPPAVFTIDLGKPVKLSRFKVWNRKFEDNYYHWGNPRFFKVYGRLETPSRDGNWSEWPLIAECEEIKPSGIASTKQMTNEDLAAAEAGFEFEIGFDVPMVRYLRFSIEQTWSGTSFAHPAEFTFWGQY